MVPTGVEGEAGALRPALEKAITEYAEEEDAADRKRRAFLVLPGVLWMLVFSAIPIVSVVVFSFWKPTPYGMLPDFSTNNYIKVFTNATYVSNIFFTIGEAFLVLGLVVAIAYPMAYFVAFHIKTEKWKTIILLMAIIPFWTSYLTRAVAWLPMLGKTGLFNSMLIKLGLLSQPAAIFLYTEPAMIFGMMYIWSVFMVGPIYFSMIKIEPQLLEAAKTLGARPIRVFTNVIFPMSLPGLMTGMIFVFVLIMGEFSLQKIIGGGKTLMLANILTTQNRLLQYPIAAVFGVILLAITLAIVRVMLRFVDIRKEL